MPFRVVRPAASKMTKFLRVALEDYYLHKEASSSPSERQSQSQGQKLGVFRLVRVQRRRAGGTKVAWFQV